MNEQVLEKEKMDSIKALSDVHIRISDAKNILFKLQEDETEYLVKREEKALTRIKKVIEDSQDLLDKAHQNYDEIHLFLQTITSYADFLQESHTKFQGLLTDFEERNTLWEEQVKRTEEGFAKQRQFIKQDAEEIEARRDAVEKATKQITNEKRKLESDRGTVERMIIRLKENRI